jgi:Ca2+/H+ antiporter, TMEM165/GDT1 family
MDAIMICLLATAIGALGGRWWLLVAAAAERLPRSQAMIAIALSIIVTSAIAAIAGDSIARQFRGPGMLLFLSLSLLLAGAGLLWPMRPLRPAMAESLRGPLSASIILLAAQVGDAAPFIILAAAARTGSAALAASGGIAGLIAVAALAFLMAHDAIPYRTIQKVRWVGGALLLAVGTGAALTAMGLI